MVKMDPNPQEEPGPRIRACPGLDPGIRNLNEGKKKLRLRRKKHWIPDQVRDDNKENLRGDPGSVITDSILNQDDGEK